MSLVRHVLLAAEGATVGDQFDGDFVVGYAQDAGNVVAVVPNPLTTRIDVEVVGLGVIDRKGRLGFEKRVLDPLSREPFGHDVGAPREGIVDVATAVGARAQDVGFGLPHRSFCRSQGDDRIGEWGMDDVLDVNVGNGRTCLIFGFGDDDGEDVTGIGRASPHGNHDWPVLVDDADHEIARYVVGGEDRNDTGCATGL